jgi:hypothetical protein
MQNKNQSIMIKKNNILALLTSISFSLLFLLISCTNNKGPDPLDCTVNPVLIQSVNSTDAGCGQSNGSIQIVAKGGNGKYMYSLDGINFQDSGKFTGLLAGNYNISVKDGNECNVSESATVANNSGFSFSFTTTESGCGGSAGSITLTVTSGIPPFQYKIEGAAYQASNVITGLPRGKYNVFAKDSIGCEVTAQVQILTGISLDKDIMPLLASNCAVSGCHDGKSGIVDWTIKTNVISKASLIKQKTQDKSMPKGGSITDAEIQTIACWVDDGAKNN